MDLTKIQPNKVSSSMLDKIWLFYGEPGTWKTTVATGDREKTLLLAYETGYKFIPGVRAIDLKNWHQLKDAIRQLEKVDVSKMFSTVAIDTIGMAYDACAAYICAKHGVAELGDIPYGKGYSMAKKEFQREINKITQLGYGLIMVAHSDEMKDDNKNVYTKVDIDKRPAAIIKGMADFILYARKEDETIGEGENAEVHEVVYAYSETKSKSVEVKKRARYFPRRIKFTYSNLKEALKQAVEKQHEIENVEITDEPDFDKYKEEGIDFKALQNEVIELAKQLLKTPEEQRVSQIIQSELPGIRLSETTKNDIPSLYSIRDQLVEIKKGLQ
ncbi:MAG: ATP-binding protein [archaeon]